MHSRAWVSDLLSEFLLKIAPENCIFTNCAPTSAASKSDFNHAKRILRLKVGVLAYTGSRLTIDPYLFYGRFTVCFVVAKQTAQLFCP